MIILTNNDTTVGSEIGDDIRRWYNERVLMVRSLTPDMPDGDESPEPAVGWFRLYNRNTENRHELLCRYGRMLKQLDGQINDPDAVVDYHTGADITRGLADATVVFNAREAIEFIASRRTDRLGVRADTTAYDTILSVDTTRIDRGLYRTLDILAQSTRGDYRGMRLFDGSEDTYNVTVVVGGRGVVTWSVRPDWTVDSLDEALPPYSRRYVRAINPAGRYHRLIKPLVNAENKQSFLNSDSTRTKQPRVLEVPRTLSVNTTPSWLDELGDELLDDGLGVTTVLHAGGAVRNIVPDFPYPFGRELTRRASKAIGGDIGDSRLLGATSLAADGDTDGTDNTAGASTRCRPNNTIDKTSLAINENNHPDAFVRSYARVINAILDYAKSLV